MWVKKRVSRRVGQAPFSLRGPIGGGFFGGGGSPVLNFANNFISPLQAVQTDIGLTYGVTPLASGAAPPVVTFGGTRTFGTAIRPVPIKITTTAGARGVATYALYIDGGVTPSQSGLTAASVPVAALPGLNVLFPASTWLGDEAYLATCAALGDNAGGALNYVSAGAVEPVIGVGVNGFCSLIMGAGNKMNSTLNLGAPGTSPSLLFSIVRLTSWTNGGRLFAGLGALNTMSVLMDNVTPQIAQLNTPTVANDSGNLPLATVGALEAKFGNSIADYVRTGAAAAVTGQSAGNGFTTGRSIGDQSSFVAHFELFALVYAAPQSTVAARQTAIAKYGALA